MKSGNRCKRHRGVTLVEIMVVIAIASILATLAAPSFNDFIRRTRQGAVASELFGDLNRARSEAIKRNARVLFCLRDTDSACDGSGDTDWRNGWLVCADIDSNNACDATTASNPNPIVVHRTLHESLTLTGPAASIRFNSNGNSGSGAATLTLGGTWAGASSKAIGVAATGNISRP